MITILPGDCRAILPTLADASVQCCVTSPPYYGLRDYGVAGQIGLEPTPDEYVAEMVAVFREVRRVLRDDGTLWLNIGDSYARGFGGGSPGAKSATNVGSHKDRAIRKVPAGYKEKDLLGIPWLLAFALRADGWFLRSDIIWHKPNPMPESVRDRPTSAHEHVFLLSKRGSYYYDADAIREPHTSDTEGVNNPAARAAMPHDAGKQFVEGGLRRPPSRPADYFGHALGRNVRNVWTIATQPYSGAHFATMPPELAERCIKAGTSEKGACPHCGAPWGRVTERAPVEQTGVTPKQAQYRAQGLASSKSTIGRTKAWSADEGRVETLGWAPSCVCPSHQPVPCMVLDPFGGAGTTGLVADRLNRNAVLIELNPDYRTLSADRLRHDAPLLAVVA